MSEHSNVYTFPLLFSFFAHCLAQCPILRRGLLSLVALRFERLAERCVVLNPDFVACLSYPLPSPALSPTERLPFSLEENGGTPFAPKTSGRHHHQHQHQHHSNYGLSLTLENKEAPLRSPNSSKALTSECVMGAGWGAEGLSRTEGGWGVAMATGFGQLTCRVWWLEAR